MEIIVAIADEFVATGEVQLGSVLNLHPEPGVLGLIAVRLATAILAPFQVGAHTQQANLVRS